MTDHPYVGTNTGRNIDSRMARHQVLFNALFLVTMVLIEAQWLWQAQNTHTPLGLPVVIAINITIGAMIVITLNGILYGYRPLPRFQVASE